MPKHQAAAKERLDRLFSRPGYIWIEDQNFLQVLKKIRVGSLRFYVSGQNLFTWTAEYLNSDPESAAGGAYRFANQKSVSFGLSLSF